MTVGVEVLVTARLPMPAAYAFRPAAGNRVTRVAKALAPGGEMLRSCCLAFVLRHPAAGTILVDTGLHPDALRSLRRDFGTRMGLFFRGLRPEAPYDEQLRARGVEPAEVERVVMTHLHVDHTSGMRLLPNARFTCARAEWTAATARGAAGKGYAPHHLPPPERLDQVDFTAQGERHGPFAATLDLLGDGSVRLVSTPGHTPGHLSVWLRGAGVLLVGDAVYTLRNLREGILPLITADDGATRRSMQEIGAFAAEEPDARLVPTHDPDAWRALAA